MMKARKVHYNTRTGMVTAERGERKETVTEDCTDLELTAGDDVSVRADPGMMHIESLTEEPLLVRMKEPGEVRVLTARKPDRPEIEPKA